MTVWPVFLTAGALVLFLGIGFIVLFNYLYIQKPRYRSEHYTATVTGTVKGRSNFISNDIFVPLVEYEVNGQTYKVAGPRFAGIVSKSIDIAGMEIAKEKSNIPLTGELPLVVHTSGGISAAQAAMDERYPTGKQVTVYYDPDCPKNAFVERDAPVSRSLTSVLIGISAAIAVLGIVFIVIALISAI